jgi:hypothetical protein
MDELIGVWDLLQNHPVAGRVKSLYETKLAMS